MKKKLLALFATFAAIILCSVVIVKVVQKEEIEVESETRIVTSFYPMYILTENLTKGVPGVKVVNLTENQTGCLHDYQLTTQDMVELSHANLLVLNGGGMEGFIERVIEQYPDLPVVRAADGIELLANTSDHEHGEEDEHVHEEEEQDHEDHEHGEEEEHVHEHAHDHGEYNAHVWMNLNHYLVQMSNVYEALVELDPEHEMIYRTNYKQYREKIMELEQEFEDALAGVAGKEVVIFHDSFAYLAQEFGLEVVKAVNLDNETYLSAGEVKEIIDEVNHHKIQVLFTEEQYSDSVAKSIAKETDASVYIIDSLVTGINDLDAYINGMKSNLRVLQDALNQ